jgi:hypothetical protein
VERPRARRQALRVNIVKGRAVEIIGPRTTYGRYRWVVKTDLSNADPFRVIAFFVRGTGGEQDIEFSRWGEPLMGTVGSWVSWRRATRIGHGFFGVSPVAPYTIDIEWKIGATRYTVHDGAGTLLLETTFASSSGGRHISPRISYWLYPGHGTSRNPFTRASVHPPVVIKSFTFTRRSR